VFQSVRNAGFALALMIAAAAPQAALAQSPEAEALGRQVAHSIFQAVSLEGLVAAAAKEMGAFDEIKSRPNWSRYLLEAMREEFEHDMPAIEGLIGHTLAREMTVDELKAGLIIMSDPAVQRAIKAESEGTKTAEEPVPQRAAERAMGSAAGRSFLRKFEGFEKLLEPTQDDLIAEIIPGAFRRFADKVEADEVRRKRAN
jgi:hypothetical protein